MKLKLFTIGLLATIALSQAEAAQKFQQQRQAVQENPQLKADLAAARANHPNLDVAAHGDNETAVDDLHAKLGAAAVPSGASANHRITDLHATIGVHPIGGLPADHANKRAEDIAARIGTRAVGAPTGPSVHEKLSDLHAHLGHRTAGGAAGDAAILKVEEILAALGGPGATVNLKLDGINTLLGATRATASRRGLGAAPVAAVQGDIHAKLTAILARLKTGLAANAAVPILTVSQSRTTHTAAGHPLVAGDFAAVALAADIEGVLTEIGW